MIDVYLSGGRDQPGNQPRLPLSMSPWKLKLPQCDMRASGIGAGRSGNGLSETAEGLVSGRLGAGAIEVPKGQVRPDVMAAWLAAHKCIIGPCVVAALCADTITYAPRRRILLTLSLGR